MVSDLVRGEFGAGMNIDWWGSSVVVTASGSDPDGDALSYEWDLDTDGTFATAGESVSFSAAELDGPSTQTIAVRVSDPSGDEAIGTATVSITSVAPSATLLLPHQSMRVARSWWN